MFKVEVDASSKINRLREKLGGGPGQASLFEIELRKAMEDTLNDMEAVARRTAKPHQEDTGKTARSITSELAPLGQPLWGRVFTAQKTAPAIEFGRRPGGKMPPEAPIADWMRRHHLDPTKLFLIRRSIAIKGTRGLFFMKAAEDIAPRSLEKYANRAFYEIQKRWRE